MRYRDLLRRLLAGLGPLVAVLITTEDLDAVQQELRDLFGDAPLAAVAAGGFDSDEGRELIERINGRPLEIPEWSRLAEIAESLHWHPAALQLVAARGRSVGWSRFFATWQADDDLLRQMEELVNRQWQDADSARRWQVEQLVRWMRRGARFGPALAAAVWDVQPHEVSDLLRQLEGTGLIEALTGEPVDAILGSEAWRVTPVAHLALRRMLAPKWKSNWRHFRDRQGVVRRLSERGGERLHAPRSFLILATIWWIPGTLAGLLADSVARLHDGMLDLLARVVGDAVAGRLERVLGRPDWNARWREWLLPGVAADRLREHWAGSEPPGEVQVLFDNQTAEAVAVAAATWAGVLIWWLLMEWLSQAAAGTTVVWLVQVIALGLWLVAEYRVLAPLAWRAWLVHLYGMETRDLRVILALAQRMGMGDAGKVGNKAERGATGN
jgi:hypothetical protein